MLLRKLLLHYCTTLLAIFCFCFTLQGQSGNILATPISIEIKNESIRAALKKIENKTNVAFVFDKQKIPIETKVSISAKNKKLKWVLEQLLAKTKIDFQALGSQISLFNNPDKKQPPVPQYTISGYLIDKSTQDPLIGATILEPKTYRGTTTNIEGFYSLTLPQGEHQLVCSYIGYQPITTKLKLGGNVKLDLDLKEGAEMEEVVVEASEFMDSRHELNVVSSHTMDIATIKSLPNILGEADVVKAMQLLPGVQSGSEGASGLFVRGGGPDQNLFLLDGVPVYNANHLFGFVSIFDSKIIKSSTIIKGGFPARYGGRLSSVLDIQTRTGDMQKFHGEVSLGLLSVGGSVEGPIWKGKTSFLISARRSWADLFAVPIQQAIVDDNGGIGSVVNYSFYDINVKLKHKFSDKNYLVLNGYFGDDFLNYKATNLLSFIIGRDTIAKASQNEDKLQWGNKIVALHWHSQLSDKLFMTSSAIYSNYFYQSKTYNYSVLTNQDAEVLADDVFESEGETPIHDIGAKVHFDYVPHNKHYIRFGASYTYHLFKPEISKTNFSTHSDTATIGPGSETEIETYTGIHEISAFIEDDIRIGKVLKINPGIHLALFALNGETYFSPQPRLLVNVLVAKRTSIKASYARMTQFVHLLTNPGIGLPTDLWLPTTDEIPPEHSHQVTLGFTQDFPFDLEFTAEGFYKYMENLLEYNPSTNFFDTKNSWENLVDLGTGESYGAEFMLHRTRGKFTGWVTYTLSWSWRQFERINRGNKFPYRYDRRHDISIALNYKFNDQFDIGLVWVYGSGHPVTLGMERYTPIQTQVDQYNNVGAALSTGSIVSEITNIVDRNNFRMPDYHRLDLSFNWNKKLKYGSQTLSIGVYNVYNQLNPYMITPVEQNDGSLKLFQTSILPIMPSISFTRRW